MLIFAYLSLAVTESSRIRKQELQLQKAKVFRVNCSHEEHGKSNLTLPPPPTGGHYQLSSTFLASPSGPKEEEEGKVPVP